MDNSQLLYELVLDKDKGYFTNSHVVKVKDALDPTFKLITDGKILPRCMLYTESELRVVRESKVKEYQKVIDSLQNQIYEYKKYIESIRML